VAEIIAGDALEVLRGMPAMRPLETNPTEELAHRATGEWLVALAEVERRLGTDRRAAVRPDAGRRSADQTTAQPERLSFCVCVG
jgi:hypothetical protein